MKRTLPSLINPLFVLPLFIAKKAAVWAFVEAGSKYGWPRVYRRLLEGSKIYIHSKPQRARVQGLIKQAIVIPGRAHKLVFDSETMEFAEKMVRNAKNTPQFKEHAKFLEFLLPFLDSFLKRTGIGRTMKLWESMRGDRK